MTLRWYSKESNCNAEDLHGYAKNGHGMEWKRGALRRKGKARKSGEKKDRAKQWHGIELK